MTEDSSSKSSPTPLEVEIRGLLTEAEYQAAISRLSQSGFPMQRDDRRTTFFIIPEKTLKVTSREDGSMAKVALKLGSIHTAKAQEEIEIPINPAYHDHFVRMFQGLGFSEIQQTRQQRINFELPDGTQIALKWSRDLGYHFEADLCVTSSELIDSTRESLVSTVKEFGLTPISEAEFRKLCERVDAEYRDKGYREATK